MGRRGPPPKSSHGAKSKVLSTRISADLREKLEETSRAEGLSLSDVISRRLKRTFVDDKDVEKLFGDRETYLLLRAVALAIQFATVHQGSGPGDRSWLHDAGKFDVALKTINRMLEQIRPEGDLTRSGIGSSATVEEIAALREYMQQFAADAVWVEMKGADPELPFNKGSRFDRQMGMLKAGIGGIAERSPATLDELNKRGAEFKQYAEESKKRRGMT